MITEANEKAAELARELTNLDDVRCSVSLHIRHGPTHTPAPGDQDPHEVGP